MNDPRPQHHRQNLPGYHGDSRAHDAHFRQSEQAEDRIQNDVDQRSDALHDHVVNRVAGRLHDSFHHNLYEHAETEYRDDSHIQRRLRSDRFGGGKQIGEHPRSA